MSTPLMTLLVGILCFVIGLTGLWFRFQPIRIHRRPFERFSSYEATERWSELLGTVAFIFLPMFVAGGTLYLGLQGVAIF